MDIVYIAITMILFLTVIMAIILALPFLIGAFILFLPAIIGAYFFGFWGLVIGLVISLYFTGRR